MLALPYGRFFPAGAVNTTPSKLFIWVDGDDLFGSEIIDTIDTFQADESASCLLYTSGQLAGSDLTEPQLRVLRQCNTPLHFFLRKRPATLDKNCRKDVYKRQGFLFTGGQDVDPQLYGEAMEPFCGELCPARDALEQELLRQALERDKPILGICRGIQFLNAALGGTLRCV